MVAYTLPVRQWAAPDMMGGKRCNHHKCGTERDTMDTTLVALIISLVSISFVILNFFRAVSNDQKKDIADDTAKTDALKESILRVNVQLDQICNITSETRTDIKAMGNKVSELDKRTTIIERDLGTAFDKIDELSKHHSV